MTTLNQAIKAFHDQGFHLAHNPDGTATISITALCHSRNIETVARPTPQNLMDWLTELAIADTEQDFQALVQVAEQLNCKLTLINAGRSKRKQRQEGKYILERPCSGDTCRYRLLTLTQVAYNLSAISGRFPELPQLAIAQGEPCQIIP